MTDQVEEAPSRACADWLDLRGPLDTLARDEGAGHLLALLAGHLAEGGVRELEVVDVGAGTGANGRYLRPRLPFAQEWVVVDHDREHLARADHGDAVRVEARVDELPGVLDALRPRGDARLLTCAALLDVLDRRALTALADAVQDAGGVALLALSVDGRVRWSPRHELDGDVRRAFDAHQRRAGRPGPDAPRVLAGLLRERGLRVTAATTWWQLGCGDRELLDRWLLERADAVLEQEPPLEPGVVQWRARRLRQSASGRLRALVAHRDLLVLPG